jgi:hypothetical protein
MPLSGLFKQLEGLGRKADLDAVPEVLTEARREYERVVDEIHALLEDGEWPLGACAS